MATPNNQFRLKLAPSTPYNFTVKWGDGSQEIYNNTTSSDENLAGITHTYSSPGFRKIIISENVNGGFPRIFFNGTDNTSLSNDDTKLINIEQWGSQYWTSLSDAFEGCLNLSSIPTDGGVSTLSGVTDFTEAWRDCKKLNNFPLIDTSNGINFKETWSGCTSLSSFPLLSTSNGTDFESAWSECSSLTAFPAINTSNGTIFVRTWMGCVSLTAFPAINTSKGVDFYQAWDNCSGLTSFPNISTLSGTNFNYAWSFCSSLTSFPLLVTLKGNSFEGTWRNCTSLASFPLISTSEGTNFGSAWNTCYSLKTFPLINMSSGIDFNHAWASCLSLTAFPPINTSNGTDFRGAWLDCFSLSASEFPTLNLSKMLSGASCFSGVQLTTTSYSSLLTSLCATNTNIGVIFNGGNSKYNSAGKLARDFLTSNRSWNITDGDLELFSPTSVAGLSLWMDANVGTFDSFSGGSLVTTNGGQIARWEDRSGNNHHAYQATSASRPTLNTSAYNSKKAVKFTNQFMSLGNVMNMGTNGVYIFALVQMDINREQIIFAKGNGTLGANTSDRGNYYASRRFFSGFYNNQLAGFLHSNGQQYVIDDIANTSTSFQLLRFAWPRKPSGSQVSTLAVNQTIVESKTTDDGSASFNSNLDAYIGRNEIFSSYLRGQICELLVYQPSTPLTTTQIQDIENYLTTKWA